MTVIGVREQNKPENIQSTGKAQLQELSAFTLSSQEMKEKY